jgi:quercetin dioxygenase-like cupin family protein
VGFRVIRPADFVWTTRPHEPDEPARHVAELSDQAGFSHERGNIWRYEPGAKGKRHVHASQAETFVVLAGTLSIYLGDTPERHDVPVGGVVHVEPGTPLQSANHGSDELLVYAHGYPPELERATLLESAIKE